MNNDLSALLLSLMSGAGPRAQSAFGPMMGAKNRMPAPMPAQQAGPMVDTFAGANPEALGMVMSSMDRAPKPMDAAPAPMPGVHALKQPFAPRPHKLKLGGGFGAWQAMGSNKMAQLGGKPMRKPARAPMPAQQMGPTTSY